MSVQIRPAVEDDAGGIRRVACGAYREAYPEVLGPETVEELLDRWYSVDAIRDRLPSEEFQRFVAVDDQVVGFASAGVPEDHGVLGTLYVHPDRWGEGIGSRLVERGQGYLRERGRDRMRIHVYADNEVGNSFYGGIAREVDEELHEVAGREVPVNVYVADLDQSSASSTG